MRHQMKRTTLFMGLLTILFIAPLSAQTANKLEAILKSPTLTWSEAVIFVLEASEKVVLKDPTEAFKYAMDQKLLPKNVQPGDTVRYKGMALLLMRSFDQKGGIFYSIFKSPHYAYRELVQSEVIRGNTDPAMTVSGQELLLMIGRLLTIREQAEQKAVK